MDKQELAKKPPMATFSFTSVTPETEYDRKILEAQEKQMMDCCDGYSPYDQYGYKPRPTNPSQDAPHRDAPHQDAPHRDAPANPESPPAPEPQDAPHRDATQRDSPANPESPHTSEPQSIQQTNKKNSKR